MHWLADRRAVPIIIVEDGLRAIGALRVSENNVAVFTESLQRFVALVRFAEHAVAVVSTAFA